MPTVPNDDVRTDAAVVANIAARAAEPTTVNRGDLLAYVTPDGRLELTDTRRFRDAPETGYVPRDVTVTTVPSLGHYVAKWGNHTAEFYADQATGTVVGVLDPGDYDDEPGWGVHRVTLNLARTPEWAAWVGLSGKLVPQHELAEFLADHVDEVLEPVGADVLELCESFEAHKTAKFKSSRRPTSGATTLVLEETVEARAGRTADLTIPDTITLALKPWRACEAAYKVTARFRYRITDGVLRFGVTLVRPDVVLERAFDDIVADVAAAVRIPAYHDDGIGDGGPTVVGVDGRILVRGTAPAPITRAGAR